MSPIRLFVASVSLAAVALATPTMASAKPDLRVTKLAAGKSAVRGAPLSAKATVRASGRVASTSAVGFLLSSNRTKGKGDKPLVGGEFVPKLRAGKSSARKATVFVPSSVKSGRYFLLACADARQRVKESSEKNNCRASRRKVSVRKAPKPRTVKPQLAGGSAVSQLVNADTGGTLSAAGPDGSTYSLAIPANALTGDETVTMTPVASVGGLPFKGAAAGVDLQPEGLVLTAPARLTITPKHAPPAGRQVTVGWHTGGQGLYLDPPAMEKGVVLAITHFSGHELVDGTAAQVATQLQFPPIRTLEQMQQAIYETSIRSRNALIDGNPAEAANFATDLVPLFQSYYDNTLKPLLTAARSDDALAPIALTEALEWARTMQKLTLIGQPDEPGNPELKARSAEVFTELGVILENALNRAGDRCLTGDLAQVQRLQALERFAQQLGTTAGDALDKVQRCLHFELDYDATWQVRQTIADNAPDAATDFTTKISGMKINGRVTRSMEEPEAAQTLQYPAYTFSSNGCQGTGATVDEQRPFRATYLMVEAELKQTVDGRGRSSFKTGAPNVTLLIDPGQRTENLPYTCSAGGGGTQHNHYFDTGFGLLHAKEAEGGFFKITNWAPGSGGVLATKTYQTGLTQGPAFRKYAEMGTFRLRHTPQR